MPKLNSRYKFIEHEWYTPNTFNTNFSKPPKKSGVYIIFKTDLFRDGLNREILYIGSSKNLSARYKSHEVLRLLKEIYDYVQFYFKEEDNYLEVEKSLIKYYKPKHNKQWL
jgi:excinuclease UvrABC nuclease subunit